MSSVSGEVMWVKPMGKNVEVGLKICEMETYSKAELLDMGYEEWREKKALETKKTEK
jgi:hypothetical protein